MDNQPIQMDQAAVNLAKAIRQVESGGNYNAVGKSNETGAYQWQPTTWQAHAQQILGDPNAPMTPQNQNAVAYGIIKTWKDQGLNAAEISARWNSGTEKDWQNKIGINKFGVGYNVPKYVKSVTDAYQTIKNGGQVQADPNNPSSIAAPTQETPLKSLTDQALNVAGTVGNFAFPILKDLYHDITGKNDKTLLQQAGDAGLSALWFLPFGDLAEGAALGAKALGIGAKAAEATGAIATGLGAGYAGDVASNLSQGKTGASTLKPGLGTVLGGGLAGAGVVAGGLYDKFLGQQQAIDKTIGVYEDALGATKPGIKSASKTFLKGLDPNAEFLAHSGIPPEHAEINGREVFTTGADSASQKTIQQRADALTTLRDQAIDQTNATGSLQELRQQMLDQAKKQFLGTERQAVINHINNEMDAFQGREAIPAGEGTVGSPEIPGQFGSHDKVPLADVNTIKKYFQKNSNYEATRPSTLTQANKMAANIAKTEVEAIARKAGSPAIELLNKAIQQHIDAIDFLNRINGQTIKGGRLGGYASELAGELAGGAIGTAGGPFGTGVGVLAGKKVGASVARFMQKLAAGGSVTAGTLGRMATVEPEIVQQFLEYVGRTGETIAPRVVPNRTTTALTSLLKKSPGSALLKRFKP